MAMDDKLTRNRPDGIDCEQYRATTGSKRCSHYADSGFCGVAVGDGGTCTEWTKLNPDSTPKLKRDPLDDLVVEPPDPLDEILPVGDLVPKGSSLSDEPWPVIPLFTEEDIERFGQHGLEYRFSSNLDAIGEIWLVPHYTNTPGKKEVTLDYLNKLALVANAFPGSRLTSFRMLKDEQEEAA